MFRNIYSPESNKNISIYSAEGRSVLLRYINQMGGGKCSLCGHRGVTKTTCPRNPRAFNIGKHAPLIQSKTICKTYTKKPPKSCAQQDTCRWLPKIGCVSDDEAIEFSNYKHKTKLIGAVSFYLWEIVCPNGSTKKILLLGDIHSPPGITCEKERRCVDVLEFVEWILNKTTNCVDLIIERPMKKSTRPQFIASDKTQIGGLKKHRDLLPQFEQHFYGCAFHARPDLITRSKKLQCQYKHLRYHNFDIRFSHNDSDHSRDILYLDDLIGEWKADKDGARLYDHARDYSILADYILGKPITNQNRLNKVLYRCIADSTHPYDFTQLKIHMKNYRKAIRKTYRKFEKTGAQYFSPTLDLRNLIKDEVDQKYTQKIQTDDEEADELTHLFTDLYLLSRIFSEFETTGKKKRRSPRGCPLLDARGKKINVSPNKVIIFAGDDHIALCNTILSKVFGEDSKTFQTMSPIGHENKIIFSRNITPIITHDEVPHLWEMQTKNFELIVDAFLA
tara:strand:+ start:920 stop:2434 length:1515 start_codon:yes stop_codon:yes gene_type:complete